MSSSIEGGIEPQDERFMRDALLMAQGAFDAGEVPVGAVIVLDDCIIGRGSNTPIKECDPTAHAEIIALRDACGNIGNYRLPGATLYVSIEPCTMCLGALMHARIGRVVYGASEPKAGVIESHSSVFTQPYWNHRMRVTGGVLADDATALMQAFFKQRRKAAKEAKKNSGTM